MLAGQTSRRVRSISLIAALAGQCYRCGMAGRTRYGRGGGTYTRAELRERGILKRELYASEASWAALDRVHASWRAEAEATDTDVPGSQSRSAAFERVVKEAAERIDKKST